MAKPTHGEEWSDTGDRIRPGEADADPEVVKELRRLQAEVDRLREQSVQDEDSRYRHLGIALVLVGAGTIAASWYLPNSRDVLLALGGTALIAAVLLFYVSPDRLVPAEGGEYVYSALAANQVAMVEELGLQDEAVYVPRAGGSAVSLFVPLQSDYQLPDDAELESLFVVAEDPASRGVAFRPAGSDLLGDFIRGQSSRLRGAPDQLVDQLSTGLRDAFGIVRSVRTSVDEAAGQASVAVAGAAFGPVDRFDNPVASFLATGFARGLDVPVTMEVDDAAAIEYDYVVTVQWSPE